MSVPQLETATRRRSESALDATWQLGSRLRQLTSSTAPVDEEDSTDTSSLAEEGERNTKIPPLPT